MLSRKKARDSVYKLIYEYLFIKSVNERSLAIFTSAEMAEEDLTYMKEVYYGVIAHYDDLIGVIESYIEKFSLSRVFKLDLAALLLAVYEMQYMPDIPMSVSISEAVELVKIYSTEKSHQYVNGVLSSVYKRLNAEEGEK